MPCYYTGSAEGDNALFAKQDLTKMTRIACEAMRELESAGFLDNMSAEALEWWKDHKRIDAEQEYE